MFDIVNKSLDRNIQVFLFYNEELIIYNKEKGLKMNKSKWHLRKAYNDFWKIMHNSYNRQFDREQLDKIIDIQFHNLLVEMDAIYGLEIEEVEDYKNWLLHKGS